MPRTKIDNAFVRAVYAPGINRVQMERYNRVKYANMPPPSVELICEVLKKTGLSQYDFEMRFGMYENTIALVKMGNRNMPKAYWHIFYDYENLDKIYKEILKIVSGLCKPKPKKKSAISLTVVSSTNLNRINELRSRIN